MHIFQNCIDHFEIEHKTFFLGGLGVQFPINKFVLQALDMPVAQYLRKIACYIPSNLVVSVWPRQNFW